MYILADEISIVVVPAYLKRVLEEQEDDFAPAPADVAHVYSCLFVVIAGGTAWPRTIYSLEVLHAH